MFLLFIHLFASCYIVTSRIIVMVEKNYLMHTYGCCLILISCFHVLLQIRFKLEEEWQRKAIFQQMGVLWRSSKSKLVRNLQKAENDEERLKLKPTNIKSITDWRKFVKAKTSPEFKVNHSY